MTGYVVGQKSRRIECIVGMDQLHFQLDTCLCCRRSCCHILCSFSYQILLFFHLCRSANPALEPPQRAILITHHTFSWVVYMTYCCCPCPTGRIRFTGPPYVGLRTVWVHCLQERKQVCGELSGKKLAMTISRKNFLCPSTMSSRNFTGSIENTSENF